jgi:hypothetical protein
VAGLTSETDGRTHSPDLDEPGFRNSAARMHDVSIAQSASIVAAALLGVVIAFQLALAAGIPWGHMAYGGRAAQSDGTLRRGHRLASGITCVVLAVALWVILAAGGVIDRGPWSADTLGIITWVLAVVFALNTVGNATGRPPRRKVGCRVRDRSPLRPVRRDSSTRLTRTALAPLGSTHFTSDRTSVHIPTMSGRTSHRPLVAASWDHCSASNEPLSSAASW